MRVQWLSAHGGHRFEVAGLDVAERTRRALAVCGFDPGGQGARGPTLLLLAEDALIEPDALRALASANAPASGGVAVCGEIATPAVLRVPAGTAAPADADGLATLAARLRTQGRLELVSVGGAHCVRVRDASQARAIERKLLRSLTRDCDGFFARHFDRHLSRRISVPLVRRRVSPNAITFAATGVGLLGALLLAASQAPLQVLGALLFVFSTVLDGCDGEVARLSLRTSPLGKRLDLIGDNVVNAAVFVAIGWSSWRADPSGALPVAVLAALIGLAFATASGFLYSSWLERSGRREALRDAYERLASRDFAYLILLLALFGRLHWFIWGAAIGSHAFAVALLALRLKEWPPPAPRARTARSPVPEATAAAAGVPVEPGAEVVSGP